MPSPVCGTGLLGVVSFTYDSSGNCEDSLNSQDDVYRDGDALTPSCVEEEGSLPDTVQVACETWPTGESLAVTIVSGEDNGYLREGGEVKVEPAADSNVLPSVMKCEINMRSGRTLQTLLISTEDPFYLKEKYGALQVQSCDDEVCLQQIEFTYYVTNAGSRTVRVTELLRDNDLAINPTEDIVQELDFPQGQADALFAGQTVSATETYAVDICQPESISFEATIDAEGNLGACEADYEYMADFEPPTCVVDVDIECTYETYGGSEESCTTLVTRGDPTCYCKEECLTTMSFLVTAARCDAYSATPSRLACNDFMTAPTQGAVYVMISADDDSMYYSGMATIGSTITIESDSCLFEQVNVYTASDMFFSMLYQSTTIQHSCNEPSGGIPLDTPFGVVTFNGYTCGDEPGAVTTCQQDITYTGCGRNRGLIPVDITGLTLAFDGTIQSILDENVVPLPTGGVYCGSKTIEIDLCGDSDEEFETVVKLIAGKNSDICEAEKEYKFQPIPRTSSPTPQTSSPTPVPTERTDTRAPDTNSATQGPPD